jgi:hypothetical protein
MITLLGWIMSLVNPEINSRYMFRELNQIFNSLMTVGQIEILFSVLINPRFFISKEVFIKP